MARTTSPAARKSATAAKFPVSAERAAEEQEYRDEDGDPENAGREAKGAA
jgi:hypothetical protein